MKRPLLIDRILAPGGLRVLFQPILRYENGWQLHAFESLVRGPAGTNIESAEVLFGYARRKQAEAAVDRACADAVLAAVADLGSDARLTVNVHGRTIERDCTFPRFLARRAAEAGIEPEQITVEIVEHSATDGGPAFASGLKQFRDAGMSIAIDDIGLGQSNYRMLLMVRPDYFKLDRFLVKDSATDPYRQAILRSLNELATSVGAWAVAEGVDNRDDLETVLDSGLRLIQGFLLAEPADVDTLGTAARVGMAVSAMPERASGDSDWLRASLDHPHRRAAGGMGRWS